MPIITIRERRQTDQGFEAVVSFGRGEYPITVSNPFSAAEEARLEWYFEHWIHFPQLETVQAAAAASSVKDCWQMRNVRCRASLETIEASLCGNDQPERVFALAQALASYGFYQARVQECDIEIERSLAALNQDRPEPATPLLKVRRQSRRVNEIKLTCGHHSISLWVLTSPKFME